MDVSSAVEKIKSMEVRGAGKIARFAVATVRDYVNNSGTDDIKELQQEVLEVFRQLNESRPTAVSLRNSLRYVYNHSIKQLSGKSKSLDEWKKQVADACESFISKSEAAKEQIAKLGSDLVGDGFSIQTHCNSQMALAVIIEAHNQGKSPKVYATESRPWYQGHLTVRQLAEAKVPVTLIVDSAVRHFMEQVDLVLVGADTISAEGDLINKIGTVQLALAAGDAGVPFVVCAETYKFSPESLTENGGGVIIEERAAEEVVPDPSAFPGVDIVNPVFDRTPAKLIKEIITEVGIIKPSGAKDLIEKEFGSGEDLDFLSGKE